MEATKLLEKQHDAVIRVGTRYAAAEEEAERRALFVELADLYSAHLLVEEKLFYPAIFRNAWEPVIKEALDAHLSAKRLISLLLETDPSDLRFDARMKLLIERIEHHAQHEETDIFPHVRRSFTSDELEALGGEMERLFDELKGAEPRFEMPSQLDDLPALS